MGYTTLCKCIYRESSVLDAHLETCIGLYCTIYKIVGFLALNYIHVGFPGI